MKIILYDKNEKLIEMWKYYFNDYPEVTIKNIDFNDIKFKNNDYIVSPGNSFGIMDGGLDELIIKKFGKDVMFCIQSHIMNQYNSFQPVGTSFVYSFEKNGKELGIIHSPTMVHPDDVSTTSNAYLSFNSILTIVSHLNEWSTNNIYVTGLCTGVGRMSERECAKQMYTAYKHYVEKPVYVGDIDWGYAFNRYVEMENNI